MRSSCRCASANLYVPVEQTALLYKEVPELLRQPWRQQPVDLFGAFSPRTRRQRPGTWPTGECGVSW